MIDDRFENRHEPSECLSVHIPLDLSNHLNAVVYVLKLQGYKVTKQHLVTLALKEYLKRWKSGIAATRQLTAVKPSTTIEENK